MLGELLDVQSSANMKGRATIPVASRSANMWARHLRRRDIQTIARWRKRAASGGAVRLGSFPRPNFGSLSSHRASGIVRHGGDQMPSRQLFDSSRFDRDQLTASGRRAAPRATRCSPRNACGVRAAVTLTGHSGGTFQGVFTRDAAARSSPGTKLGLSSVAPHH